MGTRLEELKDKCPLLNCNVGVEKTLGQLQRHWALLQQRLDTLKSRVAHTETQWKEIMLRVSSKSKEQCKTILIMFLMLS